MHLSKLYLEVFSDDGLSKEVCEDLVARMNSIFCSHKLYIKQIKFEQTNPIADDHSSPVGKLGAWIPKRSPRRTLPEKGSNTMAKAKTKTLAKPKAKKKTAKK